VLQRGSGQSISTHLERSTIDDVDFFTNLQHTRSTFFVIFSLKRRIFLALNFIKERVGNAELLHSGIFELDVLHYGYGSIPAAYEKICNIANDTAACVLACVNVQNWNSLY
jgi:hypothetical protein